MQTYRHLEIICVNDGSTDGSQAILEEYALRDSRIKLIQQANSGQSVARNRALAVARGEWVTGLDSDDYLELDIFEKAVSKLSEGVDILVFDTRLIYEKDVPYDHFDRYFRVREERELGRENMERADINTCFWGKLWRRSFIEEHAITFPEGYIHEDEYFYRCLAFHARIIYTFPQLGYNYVQHRGSTVHAGKSELQKYQDRLYIIEKIISYFVTSGIIEQARAYIMPYWANYWVAVRDSYPADIVAQIMQMNSRVISRYRLDCILGQDLCLRALLPMPRWKRLFVKIHLGGITYRFFGIHLFTVVYENDRPAGWESAWLKLAGRLLGRRG